LQHFFILTLVPHIQIMFGLGALLDGLGASEIGKQQGQMALPSANLIFRPAFVSFYSSYFPNILPVLLSQQLLFHFLFDRFQLVARAEDPKE